MQFNLGAEDVQLDWNRVSDPASTVIIDNIMEGLTTYANSTQGASADLIRPLPALAASWSISESGTKYIFHLRQTVKWSDGVLLEAKHFVDSWERLLSPQSKIPTAFHLYDIENAQAFAEGRINDFTKVGVHAINKFTLEVKLRRPAPYFLHLVASVNTFPIRKDLLPYYHWFDPEKLVTLGPYKIKKWQRGEVLLEENAKYWGDKPFISKVLCRMVTEPITALTLYENNKLDIIPRDLPSSTIKSLQSNSAYRTGSKLSVNYLVFNTQRPPFDRAEKRQAFIRGMSRSKFASFFKGAQTPTASWIPPGMVGHREEIGIGSNNTPSSLFRGETIHIRYSGNDTWNLVFQSMQEVMNKNLGLKSNIEQLDAKDYRKFLAQISRTSLEKKEPHLFLLQWVADYPDPHSFMSVFTSKSESNYTGWKNLRYDSLVESAVGMENEDDRIRLYSEAQRILLEENAVIMPLFYTSHQAMVRPDIKGVNLNALDKWYFKNFSFNNSWWSSSLGQ